MSSIVAVRQFHYAINGGERREKSFGMLTAEGGTRCCEVTGDRSNWAIRPIAELGQIVISYPTIQSDNFPLDLWVSNGKLLEVFHEYRRRTSCGKYQTQLSNLV